MVANLLANVARRQHLVLLVAKTCSSIVGVEMADSDKENDRAAGRFDLYSQIFQFVSRRISDVSAAEDVTQDVLERFMKQPPNSIHNPLAWLYRTARNAVIDHYRTRKHHESLDSSAFEMVDAELSVAPNQASQELAACLQPMIDSLPAKYSDALRKVEIDGISQVVAAQQENVSVSAMKSRVQRGRRKLAEVLGDCCNVTLSPEGEIVGYAFREQDGRCN